MRIQALAHSPAGLGNGVHLYSIGIARILSTIGPMLIRAVANKVGLAIAISIMASAYIIAAIIIWGMAYETKDITPVELDAM